MQITLNEIATGFSFSISAVLANRLMLSVRDRYYDLSAVTHSTVPPFFSTVIQSGRPTMDSSAILGQHSAMSSMRYDLEMDKDYLSDHVSIISYLRHSLASDRSVACLDRTR